MVVTPRPINWLIAPDDPQFLAVRTTFGVLVSGDSGQHWDWICERALGYSGVQDPTLGLMEGGTLHREPLGRYRAFDAIRAAIGASVTLT